ncbi:hypothetical protein R6Y90_19630 [Alteromonas macleodii]|uniref:hypothetical protein n=1 Tax=Alteromonas macleodii TaxID=28108 RepID=UPI00298290DB|nr:hypothetical protein [Alteromonas macleodii]MDW5287152.1 hypothetical protein [Alteromonas macleodii]
MNKIKSFFSSFFIFVQKHYLFAACAIFIMVGISLLDKSGWTYGSRTDAEIIAIKIHAGLANIAGAILIGFSILCLALKLHVPAHSDHPFRFNPITDFGLIRSPISELSDQK